MIEVIVVILGFWLFVQVLIVATRIIAKRQDRSITRTLRKRIK